MSVSAGPTNETNSFQDSQRAAWDPSGRLFGERMNMLAEQEHKLRTAVEEFNLAKSAKDAFKEGDAHREAALRDRAAATATRAEADEYATRTRADAKAAAEKIRAAAQESAEEMVSGARDIRGRAQDKEKEIDAIKASLEQARKALQVEQIAAENARGRANDEYAKLSSAVSALKTATQQATVAL
jgi:hypothetical protein